MANLVHVPYPGQTSCCNALCGQKIYDPPVTFRHNIGNLYPGKMVFISGIPGSASQRFSVNLKCGKTNAFHFDVRFDFRNSRNVIVRNARLDGSWGGEERELKSFPFCPDKFFEMIILVEPKCYKVAVNNEHLLEFNHRYPLEKIDTLTIKGDARICMVRIQG